MTPEFWRAMAEAVVHLAVSRTQSAGKEESDDHDGRTNVAAPRRARCGGEP